MLNSLKWPLVILMRYYRHLGIRVAAYALLSLGVAVISPLLGGLLSVSFTRQLSFDSVTPVLTILASSMLAVSTFSLNVMVTAHRAAADSTTPRVHRLLLEDTTTQSVLAVFIGAFVYSLSSIVFYQAGFYHEDAAIVVMAVTILVVLMIILAMLRWIEHLGNLGSVDDSIATAVTRARAALDTCARMPALGANTLSDSTIIPANVTEIRAPTSGYLQLIDVCALQDCLPEHGFAYITKRPGTHLLADEIVGLVSGDVDDGVLQNLADALVFGDHRTHEQDGAFGLQVLSEIASKALSPGVNDPGTAVQTVLHLKALLWDVARTPVDDTIDAPRVFVPASDPQTLLDAAFQQVARDGASMIEVAECLRQSLHALSRADDPHFAQAARATADMALSYAQNAGLTDDERDRLNRIDLGPLR